MATSSNPMITQEQPWLPESAAIDHVTSSLDHLSFPKAYTSQEHLTVGNGQNLPITHIGNSLIPASNTPIQLRNVLRVPSIVSNLASVHKICHDNNYWCYFDENILLIQALAMGKTLYKGKSEGGVYLSILTRPLTFCFLINYAILFNSLLLVSIYGTETWPSQLSNS